MSGPTSNAGFPPSPDSTGGRAAPPRPDGASGGVHAEAPPGEAAQPLDPRIAAMLPPQLLQGGEIIVLLIKPSPWFILLELLRSLAVIIMLYMLAVVTQPISSALLNAGVGPRNLTLLLLLVLGVRLFWQFLEWLSRVYVLTDRRVLRIQGVVRVLVFEAQLKKIQNTTLTFTLRERLFGLGTIGFATAGMAFTAAHWQMVARPLEVHRIVTQTINRAR